MLKLNVSEIARKKAILANVATQLKSEFYGLDSIIDRVVGSMTAWYIFPELIKRPVIVNLWGLTGVGKTQLVRRLAHLLDLYDKFVEVQMDGFSASSGHSSSTISRILQDSSIEEGERGILLLDEIQRYRTIDEHGADIKVERFQDVWMLLSDGKFSADSSMFADIEMMLHTQNWQADYKALQASQNKDEDDEPEVSGSRRTPSRKFKPQAAKNELVSPFVRKYFIYPHEAKNLKNTLKLTESVEEIMQWPPELLAEKVSQIRESRVSWEIDYSKLVIFISGNLDEAFVMAGNTNDADSDADFFHEMTKRVTVTEIKSQLRTRFKPEQISRFGNNHVIYPSLSRNSYERLISDCTHKYVQEMVDVSGIAMKLDPLVLTEIYDNSVYPAQGTRPVFSSIHKIMSEALVNITFWAAENSYESVTISIDAEEKVLLGRSGKNLFKAPIELDLRDNRNRQTADFITMVSVHECGHATAMAVLTGVAPAEVKVTLSQDGGYARPGDGRKYDTRETLINQLIVLMAGIAAEEIVFGPENRTTGSAQDIGTATRMASAFVRKNSFGSYFGYIEGEGPECEALTYLQESTAEVEGLLKEAAIAADKLILANLELFNALVEYLSETKTISQDDFVKLASPWLKLKTTNDAPVPFRQMWVEFAANTPVTPALQLT